MTYRQLSPRLGELLGQATNLRTALDQLVADSELKSLAESQGLAKKLEHALGNVAKEIDEEEKGLGRVIEKRSGASARVESTRPPAEVRSPDGAPSEHA